MLQFLKKNIKKEKHVQPSTNQSVGLNGVSLPVGVLLPTFTESSLEGPLSNFQHDGYSKSNELFTFILSSQPKVHIRMFVEVECSFHSGQIISL